MSSSRLKIAYLVGTLNHGGLESLVVDICKKHIDLDFEIVCVYRHEGTYSNAFHTTGVKMVQLECNNIFVYLYNLRRLLLNEHVNIVHAHTQSNALVCLFALLGTSIPVMTTLHGFSFAKSGRMYRSIIYGGCKKLICVSQYQLQYYKSMWHILDKHKIDVIYNGIDFSKIDSARLNVDFVSQTGRIQLAMVGSFMSGRSQSVIIKSIALLKQRGVADFDFYFVGRRVDNEPARYDDCVRFCKEHKLTNVHFLGGREDVPSILKAMDGFVYSTEHDTFGIAVVEAMAAGLPVIVNDWTVMREITNNGKWATLFKTDDADDCADKISELIHKLQTNREQVSRQCLEIANEVRNKFSIENHIKQLEQVYSSLS